MTTATGTGLDALRARYGEAFGTQLPDHIKRLPWDAGRLAARQRERLRALRDRALPVPCPSPGRHRAGPFRAR